MPRNPADGIRVLVVDFAVHDALPPAAPLGGRNARLEGLVQIESGIRHVEGAEDHAVAIRV